MKKAGVGWEKDSLRKGNVQGARRIWGIMYLKHSTEQRKSNVQLVALSNFAVISTDYHVGLADTGKKTGWGHRKNQAWQIM